jgi:hypothetical protein
MSSRPLRADLKVFNPYSAHLPYRWCIVFAFSHTFGSSALSLAYCIRFFTYIRLICPIAGALYSLFHIHSAHLPYRWRIVFVLSQTFSSRDKLSCETYKFLYFKEKTAAAIRCGGLTFKIIINVPSLQQHPSFAHPGFRWNRMSSVCAESD